MTLPVQKDVEIPLLEEIEKAGGKVVPRQVYARVAEHFPEITQQELGQRLDCGHNKWTNRVQWVRQMLVKKGQLDGSVRGVWRITELGRGRLEAHRKALPFVESGGKQDRTRARKERLGVAGSPRFDHDEIARALEKVGEAFGFDTIWKPKVNDLRPDRRAFKSKRKTLDVAWQVGNVTWVPIEVQVAGSVPDLMYRFQQVHQWSVRLIVVAVPAFQDEIEEVVGEYPFRDKLILLDPKEVLAATRNLDKLLALRAKIFEQ